MTLLCIEFLIILFKKSGIQNNTLIKVSTVTDQQDIKREKILEAAYQQFLHYGYSKTTMNEIAGALSMSKALLYYYFPDKSQLYIAVTRKLSEEYLQLVKEKISITKDLKEAFVAQIDVNHNFILSNYNFLDYIRVNEQNLPDTIWDIVEQIRQAEIELLTNAIRLEEEKGTIGRIENAAEVVGLLLDALHGVHVGTMGYKKTTFPKKEHLDEIHQKRLMLVDIFVRGLRH